MEKSPVLKPLYWVGSSKRDLEALPKDGRCFRLPTVILRKPAENTIKPNLSTASARRVVLEIVEHHDGNTYRAIYTRLGRVVQIVIGPVPKSRRNGQLSVLFT